MRPVHALLVMLAVAAGVGISATLISGELHSLEKSSLSQATTPTGAQQPPAQPTATQTGRARPEPAHVSRATRKPRRGRLLDPSGRTLAITVALELAGGALVVALMALALTLRRLRRRSRRDYRLYELHLSAHDEAKPQDLEDMVEAVANIVRAFPAERARDGQPYVALELICNQAEQGMEWSINVRCEPRSAQPLDAAIASAYPDVRLGRRHADTPHPRPGTLRVPGSVMRFRKERSFVYSLIADGEELASPPLEQIARAQVELGRPSIVRFQLTPTPSYYEELARRRYRRHEHKLARQEHWGLPQGTGLWSTFNRAEMRAAERTQNRSLFWLEAVIAADSMQACKTIAAAVQSRRGENRLHRRWTIIRQPLYRRRFPHALGPLIPSTRNLVSAAEVAHLLALPTARMKGVPVRRLMLPRIPSPPELLRGCRDEQPADAEPAFAGASNGHVLVGATKFGGKPREPHKPSADGRLR